MSEDNKQPEENKEEDLRQQAAEDWKNYVREEVNAYLDSFLEIASEGTIGVKYAFPAESTYEDGSVAAYSKKEAHGVQLLLNFKFESPLYFTDEEGFSNK